MGSFGKEEVPFRGLNEHDIALLQKETALLEKLNVPQLYDASNPNSRIFFLLADGTENDLSDPSKYTNVAKLQEDLFIISRENPHIKFAYKEGVGTRDNTLIAKADAALAFSFKAVL
jgi:hypothetical protein